MDAKKNTSALNEEPKLLSLGEMAALFKKTTRTILRHEADGLIPPRLNLPGRNALWHREEIFKFLDDSKAIDRGSAQKKVGRKIYFVRDGQS